MSRGTSKSRMLLLELLLSVFIFSFCVIICAGVFFMASETARESGNLARAVEAAQSAAEAFKATHDAEELAWLLEGEVKDGNVYVSYDAEWRSVPKTPAGGADLQVTLRQEGSMTVAEIIVYTYGSDGVAGRHYPITVSKLAREVMP